MVFILCLKLERAALFTMSSFHPFVRHHIRLSNNLDSYEPFHSVLTSLSKVEVVLQPDHYTTARNDTPVALMDAAFAVTNAHANGDNVKIVIRSFLFFLGGSSWMSIRQSSI